jgi:hypothetical protein
MLLFFNALSRILYFSTLITCLSFSFGIFAKTSDTIDHSKWQRILDSYLITEQIGNEKSEHHYFKYGAVSDEDFALLEEYIEDMQDIDITHYAPDEQFAYWINVYNAVTIALVVESYPVASIMQIGSVEGKGPWDDPSFETATRTLTLNDIEHGILRKQFADARVHYAVNCASLGCPNLSPKAFTAKNLEQQLQSGAVSFINSNKGVQLIGDNLVLSSIYSWFISDFGGNEDSLLKHLSKHANTDLSNQLSHHFGPIKYDYNWKLNEFN